MKTLVILIFLPRIMFALARYGLVRMVLGADNALLDITDCLRRWPGIPRMVTRRSVLRRLLRDVVAAEATIYATLMSKDAITIGAHAYIGFDCNLGNVGIGAGALIADNVVIMSGGRQHDDTGRKGVYQRVELGDDAWIGAGAIIMADVRADAVVGAGNVVTKPVPAGARVAGSPARVIA